MTWSNVFGAVFFLIFLSAGLRLLVGEEVNGVPHRAIFLSAAGVVMAVKYLFGFLGASDRWRISKKKGYSRINCILSLQAPEVQGVQRYLIRLLFGAIRWFLGHPQKLRLPGKSVGFLRRSSYAGLFWVIVIVLLLDLPVGYLVMKALQFPPEKLRITHSALIAITGVLLVLALGDRYWLLGSTHSLDERLLRLRLGARFQADIRLTDVSHARVVGVEPRGRRPLLEKVLLVTPLERPNVELTLAPGALDEACWYGSVPAPYQTLRLYVDDPGEFVALLTTASKGRSSEGEAAA